MRQEFEAAASYASDAPSIAAKMMRLPLKRRPRSLVLLKYSHYYPIRGVRDSRLAMADELYYTILHHDLDWHVYDIEPGSAITQAVAIKLRGRGPSADYMAAVLAREVGAKVAPGRDLSRIIAERYAYTQYTQEMLLQESRGCRTFIDICHWIHSTSGDGPPPALCRELLMPQMRISRPWNPCRWVRWRCSQRWP